MARHQLEIKNKANRGDMREKDFSAWRDTFFRA